MNEFLPNDMKIDNFELYRFKVGSFLETQCTHIFHSSHVGQTHFPVPHFLSRIFSLPHRPP